MTARASRTQRLEPLPDSLLTTPLDYLLAEHHRHRVLCRLCDDMAVCDMPDAKTAGMIADALERELVLHMRDEEEDLFPLLRRSANPDDGIDRILDLLSRDHARDMALAASIVSGLRRLAGGRSARLTGTLRRKLETFARDQRKHVALENAIVMPLARVRLSRKDLARLAQSMAARRGIVANG